MKTIETVLKEFLDEQRQLLNQEKSEDYEDYEEVVNLFVQFLNSYAYLNLGEEDAELFDELFNNEDKEYCEIFGTEYIRAIGMWSFFGDFITRKGPCSKTFMKTVGRVMPELINWLHEKGHMGDEEYNKINAIIKEFKDDI